jgi:hypothetical protein
MTPFRRRFLSNLIASLENDGGTTLELREE